MYLDRFVTIIFAARIALIAYRALLSRRNIIARDMSKAVGCSDGVTSAATYHQRHGLKLALSLEK